MQDTVKDIRAQVTIHFKNNSSITLDVSDDNENTPMINYCTSVDINENLYQSSADNIVGNVCGNTLSLELVSKNRLLIPNNQSSVYYGLMDETAYIEITFTYKDDEDSSITHTVPMGRYFVDTWEGGTDSSRPNEVSISADNAADFRPGNQKEVDVPGVCCVRGIAMPVVPPFFSQIEAAFCRVVVEITDGSSVFPGEADIKGDVLIERVCFFCIIAEGISGGHTQKALCLVHMPGLFPEAVKVILILYAYSMNPPAVAVFPVTELRDILVDQLSVPVEYRDKKRVFMDHNAQAATL